MLSQNNNLNKIKTIIENSGSFAILLDKKPEEYEFLAAEALKQALNIKNRPVLILPPDAGRFKEKWGAILQSEKIVPFPQKTTIKLPKKTCEIEKISYKEEDGYLSFIITSGNNGILSKEDISLEKSVPEAESVFCFFEKREGIKKFENSIVLPSNEKMIFITPNNKTLTEKCFNIIKFLDENILNDKNISSLLFASLIIETENFAETTEPTLRLGAFLAERGERQEKVMEILKKEKDPSFAQILGRVLARTYVDNLLGVSWSFLNYKDFQKTNNIPPSPLFLYGLLKKVRLFINQNLYILIWQSVNGIMATVTASKDKNREYLSLFAEKMQANLESRFFTIGPFENFSQAEINIRKAIKGGVIN